MRARGVLRALAQQQSSGPPDGLLRQNPAQQPNAWATLARPLAGQLRRDATFWRGLIVIAADTRPIQRPLAHRAWCSGRVNVTIREVAAVEAPRSIADGQKFGVGGRIALQDNVIPTFANDNALAHDDGSIRLVSFAERLVP